MTNLTGRFFLVALGFTWLFQLPVVLAERGLINAEVDPLDKAAWRAVELEA